ncbi:pyruvate dehydrogenase complex dihydrolipoamide acetyltransferase [Acidomonas methanolica]|uniref:Acetyltransferase component of pyruvate dehydrogenase complex n=1 Tax=Acidomonas methanolica NBRC 104435 TaxID=1231351 RepID=A0A023D615_ACIMT|nr:pyruvate dehydrogenase complex dihydrolipoamide acetyltransferase [Acidomonas methanolica]MBU2655050.1 pyruvate dehydrogenase complex dihydrolipoamide acetyltransferase [Acidomonas methanolica]TCS25635.1 pyruvate dehydrogenase E2 component (dihydrolipoamide acetyltransferase) [Acidomonas methanolica]GAJ29231.1 dihydrolipoamide acetyltransferase/pyruvate dehydrogenase E2 component [Acidomonas methanolica NBRC 104435]GBQ52055.1 dihydrolipoamide acetyltransferase component [Acidomonas methanoli
MATELLMPALSPTMTEGKLARWVKQEGDSVASGDVIAEIETDKATMEIEAVEEGILGRILVAEGTEGVAVNTPIGILVAEGEDVPSGAVAPKEKKAPSESAATARPEPAPKTRPEPARTPGRPAPTPSAARLFASPLARRIAKDRGVDLAMLKGSGPNGRILRRDVEAAEAMPSARVVETPVEAPVAGGGSTATPLSSMRKVIARRLTEAKATVPHFYVSIDVRLDALLALRAQLRAAAAADGNEALRLSVNDMLIKAAALTLRRVPEVNVSFGGDTLIQHQDIDISMAVAIPDGLITPIIRRADRKSLREIGLESAELAARAKAGKLKPEEFQGGTFSVSNMGMFGVSAFSAIINPPQAAILAIAAGEKRPVVKDDALAIATVMTATLSADHRVIDGALAARWMAAFRSVVENPMTLVL